MGDQKPHRQPLHTLDQQTKHFQGGRIDPVGVLANRQHRLLRGESGNLFDRTSRVRCFCLSGVRFIGGYFAPIDIPNSSAISGTASCSSLVPSASRASILARATAGGSARSNPAARSKSPITA
jgi:hypothetical protein